MCMAFDLFCPTAAPCFCSIPALDILPPPPPPPPLPAPVDPPDCPGFLCKSIVTNSS